MLGSRPWTDNAEATIRSRVAWALCVAVVATIFPVVARASDDDPIPAWRLVHRSILSARGNPLGLSLDGRLTLNRRLFVAESAALRESFVALGVVAGLTPSMGRIGVVAELQPATFLTLWASAERVGYLGTFRQMSSFPSATSAYDEAVLKALAGSSDAGPYATQGARYVLGALLRLQARWLLVRDLSRFARTTARLRAGDRVFYDVGNDLLAENDGWVATNDLDVAWKGEDLVAGLRWGAARALYGDDAFAPVDDRSLATGWLQRLGPFVAKQWAARPGRPEITLFGHAGWWLAHPSRIGPVPMVQLGVSMTGDLW
jgi:hypothetical protein